MSVVSDAKTQGKRRSRPLTSWQERLFFGVAFAVAALFQIGVVCMETIVR